ncbi:MAG: prolyl oligopeptidase family serine peptidase [Fuerstiella sp.]
MRNLVPVTALFLLVTACSASAQNQRGPRPAVSPETLALYEPGEFKGVKYRLMKPIDFDPDRTYPLILSLHGAGGRGSQNIKNLRNWNEWLADEELRRTHPCFVLAPQSPGSWFDPAADHSVLPEHGTVTLEDIPEGMRKFGQRALELAASVAKNPNDPRIINGVLGKVLQYIDTELLKQYRIDTDRVYCLGHSMGGMGTFTAVYQHPDRFAAAIPSAGIFYPWLDAKRIKDVPLWIFHGNDDKVVDYVCSRHPFERLRKLNANTKLTTVTGVGHGSNSLSFNYTGDDPDKGYFTEYASDRPDKTDHVWDWLFKQKRSGQVGRADINKTLQEINDRFKQVDVELVEWPEQLHQQFGKLKKIAFMAYPTNRPKGKLPLLISLHGAGGRKMSLQEQLARSAEVKGLALAELAGRDLILLEPNSADIWRVESLNTMLDYILENHPEVDTNRIYVMGHSMGGYGTWAWINESADRFAAASPSGIPIGDSGDVASLVDLPIWGMVGGGDKKDRVAGIKRMVERLRAAGNKHVKYTEFPGADHAAGNAAVFSSVDLVNWMLGFSRAE